MGLGMNNRILVIIYRISENTRGARALRFDNIFHIECCRMGWAERMFVAEFDVRIERLEETGMHSQALKNYHVI